MLRIFLQQSIEKESLGPKREKEVITEKNLPEVIKIVKACMGVFVFYGLDPASFKNLALNFEQIKRYIEQQKEVILYYEEAVKPKEK